MSIDDFRAQLTHVLKTNYFVRECLFPVWQAIAWLALALGLALGYWLGYLTWSN